MLALHGCHVQWGKVCCQLNVSLNHTMTTTKLWEIVMVDPGSPITQQRQRLVFSENFGGVVLMMFYCGRNSHFLQFGDDLINEMTLWFSKRCEIEAGFSFQTQIVWPFWDSISNAMPLEFLLHILETKQSQLCCVYDLDSQVKVSPTPIDSLSPLTSS